MGVKIRKGLRNVCVFPLLKDLSTEMSEDGNPVVQYGAKVNLPNVQTIELKMTTQTESIDSDDASDVLTQCTGCDVTIKRNFISPEEQRILLNEKVIDGMNVSTGADEPGEFAMGFQCAISGGDILYMLLLKTKFSLTDLSAESGGDEKLSPQPDSITAKASRRRADDAWRFYVRSTEKDFGRTFFSVDTLQKLADAAVQIQPQVAEVLFVDTLPNKGEGGKVYIHAEEAYYWDGSNMVKCASKTGA